MDEPGRLRRLKTRVIGRMACAADMERDSLLHRRVQILTAVLFTAMTLSFFVLVPVIYFTLRNRLYALLVFDLISWGAGLYLLLSKRLPYEARAATCVLLLYAVGLYIIACLGLASGGSAWLFTFAVMAGVLLGERAAALALLLNALTLTTIGWLLAAGRLGQGPTIFGSTGAMVVAGVNFMFLNTIAALSAATLVKGLVATHRKEKELAETLGRERSRLLAATTALESQVQERERAEIAVRRSEAKYRNLVENVQDVIYSLDAEGRIVYISPAVTRLAGYDPEDILGRPFTDFIHGDDVERLKALFPAVLGGRPVQEEYRVLTRTGETRWIHSSSQPTGGQGESGGLQGVLTDITEQKSLKAQLQQARKMEAIGTLAGGIAHEFNNILAIIVGNIELEISARRAGGRSRDHLQEARGACLRGREVVQQLLGFSRQTGQDHRPMDLGAVVRESMGFLRACLPAHVQFEAVLPPSEAVIMGDATQVHQIMINLCTNAAHAMEAQGGLLKVNLSRVTLDRPEAFFHTRLMPGRYACLCIADTGHGIRADELDRVFDPFFTTKDIGKGSGMGLAVVLGLVEEHRGGIRVFSRAGAGTSVECCFPLVGEAAPEVRAGAGPVPGGEAGVPQREGVGGAHSP